MFLCSSVLTCYLINMKNIILVVFLIMSNFFVFGQVKKVNNYKFIVVPDRFDFLKQKDEYKTSSLTKFLLKKNGFTVVLNSEQYPKDLIDNPCSGLKALVLDKSSVFKVKVVIELRDCSNRLLYTSEEGVSRLKEFKKGFQEAIRKAHASMNNIAYEPFLLETIRKDKKEIVIVDPVLVKEGKEIKLKSEIPAINNIEKAVLVVPINNIVLASSVLYAQPVENGFQLINSKPTVVFVILKTKVKGVFILKDKNGVLYKKEGVWIAEFYENGTFTEKKYQVKF
jgi:hypothetical protein